jgi:hypothetical protein
METQLQDYEEREVIIFSVTEQVLFLSLLFYGEMVGILLE